MFDRRFENYVTIVDFAASPVYFNIAGKLKYIYCPAVHIQNVLNIFVAEIYRESTTLTQSRQ